MKTKIFKRAISVLLVAMLVCSLFTGTLATNVSAEEALPTFNGTTQSKLVNWSGSVLNTTPFDAGELPVKDKSAATYVKYTVTPNASTTANTTTQWVAINLKIADVIYDGAKCELRLTLESQHGHTLGVYDENGAAIKRFWLRVAYLEDETLIYKGTYNFTAKVEGNSVSLWWGDEDITLNEDMGYDLSDFSAYGMTVNGAKVGATYNWGSLPYSLTAEAWTANDNSHLVCGTGHYRVQDYTSGNSYFTSTDGNKLFNNYADIVNESGVVYTSINVKPTSAITNGCGPYVMVAKTDYKVDENDTATWYLGFRLTGNTGYIFTLFNFDNSATVPLTNNSKYLNGAYADGTKSLKAKNYNIMTKVGNGKASVWFEGKSIILDYAPQNFNIISAVGANSYGYGYYINFAAWVEADNYKYALPEFDASSQTKLVDTTVNVSGANAYAGTTLDVVDSSKATYIEYSFSKVSSLTNWYSPYLILADVTYNNADYKLAIRMSGNYGYYLSIIGDNYSVNPVKNISGWAYPDTGSNAMGSSYTVKAKIENGALTLWIVDSTGKVTVKLTNYTSADFVINNPRIGAGYNYGSQSYSLSVDAWTATANYKYITPEINDEDHFTLGRTSYVANVYNPESTTVYNFTEDVADDSQAVYTRYILYPPSNSGDAHGHLIYLAKTSTEGKYYAMRATKGQGYTIGIAPTTGTGIGSEGCVVAQAAYPNGSKAYTSAMTVIVKVENGKVTVWINDTVVLKEHNFGDVTGAAVGITNLGASSNIAVTTWTENANYGKLGDLNADRNIDILDYIRMMKISVGEAEPFNEAVMAFNAEGTINPAELIQMKKYLLGVIDELTPTSGIVYGDDIADSNVID